MSDFEARLRRGAVRRGALDAGGAVLLSDGAEWIENSMRRIFAGVKMTFVLDLFHVLEKLQDALKEMIPDAAPRRSAFGRLKAVIMAGGGAPAVNEPAPHGDDCPAVRAFVNHCRPDPHRMRYG